jgi:hypothetical protein
MVSSGMLRRVALVRTDVSEEISASLIRVTRIGELETTLAVTNNRRTVRRNTNVAYIYPPYSHYYHLAYVVRWQSTDVCQTAP